MSEPRRSWKKLLADHSVNEARAAIYEQLMDAQEKIAHARYEVGVDDAAVQTALDQADEELSEDERREDLYVSALRHYVRALGGQLEVRAVFPDQTVVVLRDLDPPAPTSAH